eukprot:4164484-Pleurochrysis_carterae.AAC.1
MRSRSKLKNKSEKRDSLDEANKRGQRKRRRGKDGGSDPLGERVRKRVRVKVGGSAHAWTKRAGK